MAHGSEETRKPKRVMLGVDETTDGLLTALAKFDGSTKVHVVRQLVRAAARNHYGTVEAALMEVRRA
jgi:hypothetical protein